MPQPSSQDLARMARRAGYSIQSIEQLRSNRWLLTLLEPSGEMILAMIQARPLIGAADVQDLAEIARLRHPSRGLLVALNGSFSRAADQTLAEIGNTKLRLCTHLPDVTSDSRDSKELRSVSAITQV